MHKKDYKLFIDGEKYTWADDTISGAQLRVLGAIPEGVEIYLQVPGKPDEIIEDGQHVSLKDHHGPARFSTQAPGSQAG